MQNKSNEEHKYTSTGIKFWCHDGAMTSYRNDNPNTIISTHISPEGRCNLKCEYCSVTYRKTHNRIDLDKIKRYVLKLKQYGLKAVIITGGGEPTLYPQINELLTWLKYEQNLEIGLITNGTQSHRIEYWDVFSWVRVSFNLFKGWEQKITVPIELLHDECVLGGSFVYTGQDLEIFRRISTLANQHGFEYVRVLPNCLLIQDKLIEKHDELHDILVELDNPIFFQQNKLHGTPDTPVCHQSYFRPYLSEVNGGTVYPCDSVVLNDSVSFFHDKFALCDSDDIDKYLLKRIKHEFDPRIDCKGCVFTDNVMMLDKWYKDGDNKPKIDFSTINHKNFV